MTAPAVFPAEPVPRSHAENLISLLAHDDEHGKLVAALAPATIFEGDYQEIATRLLRYWRDHGCAPRHHTQDLFADITGDSSPKADTFRRILWQMSMLHNAGINTDYVLRTLREAVQWHAYRAATYKAAQMLDNDPTPEKLEQLAQVYSEVTRIQTHAFDPGVRLDEIDSLIEYLKRQTTEFSTGISVLDQRGIVPARGTVFLFLAGKGRSKCISTGEPVLLSDGRYIPIEEVRDGDCVPSLDRHGNWQQREVRVTSNGIKPVFEVQLRSGRLVRLTAEHPLLTDEGWKPVSALRAGDQVACPASVALPPRLNAQRYSLMRILGYLIADGGLTSDGTPVFSKQDLAIVDDMNDCLADYDCSLNRVQGKGWDYRVVGTRNHNKILELLREQGLSGKRSNAKFIPQIVFTAGDEEIADFLSALFTCDGSVWEDKGGRLCFDYTTTSERLIRDIDHLLTRFGIIAKIRRHRQMINGQPYESWRLFLRGREPMRLLYERIGLLSIKGLKLKAAMEESAGYHSNTGVIGVYRRGDKFRALLGVGGHIVHLGYFATLQEAVAARQAAEELHGHENRFISRTDRCGDLFFDSIEQIVPLGKRQTYDLFVERTHNFVCGNVLVHNTWFLVNCGRRALVLRKRVLHVSLENSEEEIKMRYWQNMFAVPKHMSDSDQITLTRLNLHGEDYRGHGEETVPVDFAFDSPELRAELESRVSLLELRYNAINNLMIKRFPNRSLTVDGLRGHLDLLERVEGFVPDMLVLDYAKLMKVDMRDVRHSIGHNMELIRGLGVERNMAVVTADQFNREGYRAKQGRSIHIGEDWSQVHTADIVVAHSATDAEFNRGLARVYVEHARTERDKFACLITQALSIGQYCLQSVLLPRQYSEELEQGETQAAAE